jgi:ubiquinone/menaquinone biosynthesis C-methylase UbiE
VRRTIARELMDEPVDDVDELEANLRDIAFANAWLGGSAPVVRAVRALGAGTILDVGSGAADVPLALANDAARRGAGIKVTCLDRSEQMLEIARRRTQNHPALTFLRAEGEALPFGDAAFDAVTCTLALHHFEPAAARTLLRELRRVARISPIVCDLRRSAVAFCATWLWSRTSRNRLTRHDGPLSVRRAYTPAEALELAREAGWSNPHVKNEPFFRMTLTDISPAPDTTRG